MTRRCPAFNLERKPDEVFWKQVREKRYEIETPSRPSSFDQYESPHLADGTSFTAAPRGIPLGNGCYRSLP